MAWIELHQSLPGHRKIMRIRRTLKIGQAQAVGHLCMLWLWCLDSCPDGDLSDLMDCEIAEAAGYDGKKPEGFVSALLDVGFLDADRRIHDWDTYAGRLMDRREQTKEQTRKRVERYRARQKPATAIECNALHSVTGNGAETLGNAPTVPNPTVPNPTVPNPTVPNPTVPNQTISEGGNGAASPRPSPARFTPPSLDEVRAYCKERENRVDPEKWHDFYAAKGWKVGNQAMKDWKAAVRTWEQREDRRNTNAEHRRSDGGDNAEPAPGQRDDYGGVYL